MRKILVVDFSTLKGHHEIYFIKFIKVLAENNYITYFSCVDNSRISKIYDNENCISLVVKLSILEKAFISFISFMDCLAYLFFRTYKFNILSVISLIWIKNLQNQIGYEVPVIFLHIDFINSKILLWIIKYSSLLPARWSALYIKGLSSSKRHEAREEFFKLNSCKSLLLLDPFHIDSVRYKFKSTQLIWLPEVVDVEADLPGSRIVSTILKQSKNRKIVSIIGSLLPKRNIILFLEAVKRLSSNSFFILIIGELLHRLYTKDELEKIENSFKQISGNSYIQTDYYIPCEKEFNALLMISDLVYLQYKDHPYSSNILAKAIKLRKPVIVNDGYLMAKIVQKYNWQAVLPEDPEQVADAIKFLTFNFEIDEEKYSCFLHDFSEENFKNSVLTAAAYLYCED